MEIKGKVIGVENVKNVFNTIVQGVKRRDAHKYRFPDYRGGNGTYAVGWPTVDHRLDMVVAVGGRLKPVKIDVKDAVLSVNGRSRITGALVAKLEGKLRGATVDLTDDRGRLGLLDDGILKV
jgi:hypothetical protein